MKTFFIQCLFMIQCSVGFRIPTPLSSLRVVTSSTVETCSDIPNQALCGGDVVRVISDVRLNGGQSLIDLTGVVVSFPGDFESRFSKDANTEMVHVHFFLLGEGCSIKPNEIMKIHPDEALDVYSEAGRLLDVYDRDHRVAAKTGGAGMGGGLSGNAFAASLPDRRLLELRAAVQCMAKRASRVTLGICAEDTTAGVGGLKDWVTALSLPRGSLHGMDVDGVPIEIPGHIYIKYNSGTRTFADIRANGGIAWKPGDAFLSGYDGDFEGVGFSPWLPTDDEDALRLCAYLPLGMFNG